MEMEMDFRSGALEKAVADPESTKGRILQAAEDCFAELGYRGTTTRDIADAAGVNMAQVHYHWGSKEELWNAVNFNVFMSAIKSNFNLFLDTAKAFSEASKEEQVELLRGVIAAVFNIFERNRNIPLLIQEGLQGAGGKSWTEYFGLQVLEMYEYYIDNNTDLDFDPVETRLAVFCIQGAMVFFFARPELVKLLFDEDIGGMSESFREKAVEAMWVMTCRYGRLHV